MTGHIPGTTVLRRHVKDSGSVAPGSNHVALRAANERLILSLIRKHGQLSKAQIAELSGLTVQTASVISRSLIEAGLLVEGNPVRGRVGQPFVPLNIAPDGAMFFGLHVCSGKSSLALVNFSGMILEEKNVAYRRIDLSKIKKFTQDAIAQIRSRFNLEKNSRIQGLGVSVASDVIASLPWHEADEAFAGIGAACGLTSHVSSEAIAGCNAELIFGRGMGLDDFAYIFIGDIISGGLVQNGRVRFSRENSGANIGKVLVHDVNSSCVPLSTLSTDINRSNSRDQLTSIAKAMAYASYSASSIVKFDTLVVDGSLKPDLMQEVCELLRAELTQLDGSEASSLSVRQGTRTPRTVALGAACLPLADRFFPDVLI